ncbi:MAG: hypothetical protein GY730_02760 [bacterium]|nr:hypothetical protein [bacterium]
MSIYKNDLIRGILVSFLFLAVFFVSSKIFCQNSSLLDGIGQNSYLMPGENIQSNTGRYSSGTRSEQVQSIVDFLKVKYFARLIIIVDKKGKKTGEGITSELIIKKDGYIFVLEDNSRVNVVFKTAGKNHNTSFQIESNPAEIKKQVLNKRLEVEQMISSSINNIGGDDSNNQKPLFNSFYNHSNKDHRFISSGRVCYYDGTSSDKKIADAMVKNGRVFLRDGMLLSVNFERM